MHKSTKLTPFSRREIYIKYQERMIETRGRKKEVFYKEISPLYRVHYNIIRKVCKRWRLWDFEPHKSTRKDNLWHNFKNYLKSEKKILKRVKRAEWIERYEKEMAWELVHIDIHKRKNIQWENPKKKKYIAWVIDDATRMKYGEELPNKKAKTLAWFIKRAYKWFQDQWVTIKKLLSDNGLEFTTHHVASRQKHSFEMMQITSIKKSWKESKKISEDKKRSLKASFFITSSLCVRIEKLQSEVKTTFLLF